MNILFFLTPKAEVAYLYDDFTVRQALEKMEYHHYSQIPILNKDGDYVGNLTEGDLLWFIKDHDLNLEEVEDINITEVKTKRKLDTIKIDAQMQDLYSTIFNQNYIPVVDDRNKFIGIITRKKVLTFLKDQVEGNIK